MAFYVGQEVVCVDDSLPNNPRHRANMVVKNRIYIVRAIGGETKDFFDIDGSGRMWECERFRPIVRKKTDISVFTEILYRENLKPKPWVEA